MTEDARRTVVLIEDDPTMARVYKTYMARENYRVVHAEDGRKGLDAIERHDPDAILLDLKLPDMDGMEILERLQGRPSSAAVVVITANGSVNTAVAAMRAGAKDFIVKPFGADRLLYTLKNVLERQQLAATVQSYEHEVNRDNYGKFIGKSPAMQAVYKMIERAAPSKATVFVTGESGTGKEICAEAIHRQSPRADKPFVAINCGAIPKDLMESEVFGHVKGAFTGAVRDRDGAATLADGGTMFLDEICEMDAELQTKLLRFIQTSTFQKVGGSTTERVDVRFLCATNRDPLREVDAGTFREDLYYRLHVIPIHLPPLRKRDDDVLLIARRLLVDYAKEEGKAFARLAETTERAIRTYSWPGNVRQLQNVIRNIVVLNEGDVVLPDMLPAPLDRFAVDGVERPAVVPAAEPGSGAASTAGAAAPPEPAHDAESEPEAAIVSQAKLERNAIERAIDICDGNIPRAAHYLGVSGATIYRKRSLWKAEDSADEGRPINV